MKAKTPKMEAERRCERKTYRRARKRALARLREGMDLRWTPPRNRDELHQRQMGGSLLLAETRGMGHPASALALKQEHFVPRRCTRLRHWRKNSRFLTGLSPGSE
jgi:hypothetical protein